MPPGKFLGILAIVAASVVYGLYPTHAKLAYQHGVSQTFVIIFSTFVRALALTLVAACWQKHSVKRIIAFDQASFKAGIFQSISIFGIIYSLKYISGSVMITIVFTHATMLIVFTSWKEGLRLKLSTLASVILALVGVALVVNILNGVEKLNLFGVSLAFLAALATAVRMYIFGQQAKTIPSIIVGARVMFIAGILNLVLVFLQKPIGPSDLSTWINVLICSGSLAAGGILTFWALSVLDVCNISVLAKIEPICTTIYAYLILNEVLFTSQYVGMIFVISSLVAYQLIEQRKRL